MSSQQCVICQSVIFFLVSFLAVQVRLNFCPVSLSGQMLFYMSVLCILFEYKQSILTDLILYCLLKHPTMLILPYVNDYQNSFLTVSSAVVISGCSSCLFIYDILFSYFYQLILLPSYPHPSLFLPSYSHHVPIIF